MIELDEYRESAALSAGNRLWQSVRCASLALGGAALLGASPAQAVPGGVLGTLKRGSFACELAGDALGKAGIAQPAEDFDIVHSSTYATPAGRGSYLMTGDQIIMTSGPKQGQRYKSISENFVRQLDAAGAETSLRCVRRVMNNQ